MASSAKEQKVRDRPLHTTLRLPDDILWSPYPESIFDGYLCIFEQRSCLGRRQTSFGFTHLDVESVFLREGGHDLGSSRTDLFPFFHNLVQH
ncbi:hypothetical protein TNCV_3312091 [Trichonephila clavipes]|nr:hypothetical protein TNCV_3312091 [Trichonephila clavipes]